MKFEYNMDPVWRIGKFGVVGRSGFSPKKYRFACNLVFRNGLLISKYAKF